MKQPICLELHVIIVYNYVGLCCVFVCDLLNCSVDYPSHNALGGEGESTDTLF